MNKTAKIVVLIAAALAVYYGLQLASTAVHYNCATLKDDCPPPIYGAAEIIYRVMVQPPWLDQYKLEQMVFTLNDGKYTFWEGEVEGETVVIRVPEEGSPVLEWIFEQKLPGKIPIIPAKYEHIREWLKAHPEYILI